MDLLYRPSIPDNITNKRVFNDDQNILIFLHLEGTLKDSIIDESQHDQHMNYHVTGLLDQTHQRDYTHLVNSILKNVVILEKWYDIHDKFKRFTNHKTNSSVMQFEVVNLGTRNTPQTINLGKKSSSVENKAFIKFFK